MAHDGASQSAVLVTGAAGFVGYHVAERLLASGQSVVGLDNVNSYYDPAIKDARLKNLARHDAFSFHKIDLADRSSVMDLMRETNPQHVVHLAAQAGVRYSLENPHAYSASNLEGFLSILEASRATKPAHVVYASSSSVYGTNTKVPFHEDDPVVAPVSLYAATKRANELMATAYAHLYSIPLSALRFFTVYGPYGRPDMAYFSFTKAIMEGRPIKVFNHGKMRRDFTYVDDIVEAIIRLLDAPPAVAATKLEMELTSPHIIYNIGNHTPVELRTFIETIEQTVGREAVKEYLPMQPGDVPATYADVERLSKVTGFAPRTPLSEGIKNFVAWYREFYPGSGEITAKAAE